MKKNNVKRFKKDFVLKIFLFALVFSGAILAYRVMFAATRPTYPTSAQLQTCYNKVPGGDRVACFAEKFVGYGEVLGSPNNDGAWPKFWNDEAKCGNPNPWCASFVSYMLRLGRNSWDVNTCGTSTMIDQFKNKKHQVFDYKGGYYKIYRGDIVYRSRPDGGVGKGHVGIVNSVKSDGSFVTVEGNTKCGDNECVRYRNYYKNGTPMDSDNTDKPAWDKVLRW